MKIFFETQYRLEGKNWLRCLDRHPTQEAATAKARSMANEEIETRTARVTVEILDNFPRISDKPAPPIVLPGMGIISVEESKSRITPDPKRSPAYLSQLRDAVETGTV